jgi:hypothetical protein
MLSADCGSTTWGVAICRITLTMMPGKLSLARNATLPDSSLAYVDERLLPRALPRPVVRCGGLGKISRTRTVLLAIKRSRPSLMIWTRSRHTET